MIRMMFITLPRKVHMIRSLGIVAIPMFRYFVMQRTWISMATIAMTIGMNTIFVVIVWFVMIVHMVIATMMLVRMMIITMMMIMSMMMTISMITYY